MKKMALLILLAAFVVMPNLSVLAQPTPFQPQPHRIQPADAPAQAVPSIDWDESGRTTNRHMVLIWSLIGFFLFLLHTFIAVFIIIDGRKRKVGGAVGWAIFGFIPVLGLIGLFVYLFVSNSAQSESELQEIVAKAVAAGQERGKREAEGRLTSQMQQLQDELERIKSSVSEAPIVEEEVTEIINNTQGRSGIMLLHMGGERDGHPEQLDIRNPLTGRPKKVKIGKNAEGADIALPWDKSVSRPHCELSFEVEGDEDKYYVYDLNSSNGTFLRKGEDDEFHEVEGKAYMRDGDILRVGNSQFRVVIFKPVEVEKVKEGADAPPISDFTAARKDV